MWVRWLLATSSTISLRMSFSRSVSTLATSCFGPCWVHATIGRTREACFVDQWSNLHRKAQNQRNQLHHQQLNRVLILGGVRTVRTMTFIATMEQMDMTIWSPQWWSYVVCQRCLRKFSGTPPSRTKLIELSANEHDVPSSPGSHTGVRWVPTHLFPSEAHAWHEQILKHGLHERHSKLMDEHLMDPHIQYQHVSKHSKAMKFHMVSPTLRPIASSFSTCLGWFFPLPGGRWPAALDTFQDPWDGDDGTAGVAWSSRTKCSFVQKGNGYPRKWPLSMGRSS